MNVAMRGYPPHWGHPSVSSPTEKGYGFVARCEIQLKITKQMVETYGNPINNEMFTYQKSCTSWWFIPFNPFFSRVSTIQCGKISFIRRISSTPLLSTWGKKTSLGVRAFIFYHCGIQNHLNLLFRNGKTNGLGYPPCIYIYIYIYTHKSDVVSSKLSYIYIYIS